jgi:hypothetical protein
MKSTQHRLALALTLVIVPLLQWSATMQQAATAKPMELQDIVGGARRRGRAGGGQTHARRE